MSLSRNLLGDPAPTLLPLDAAHDAIVELGASSPGAAELRAIAARFPASSAAWALLAERSLSEPDPVAAYAFARTGYHRGLDALRRAGWRGQGPVPWSHEPNQGFLRCVNTLAHAAAAIGEADEAARCAQLLRDCDPSAADELS